jgi:hypothetical protein
MPHVFLVRQILSNVASAETIAIQRGGICSIPPPKGEGGRRRSWTGGGRVGSQQLIYLTPTRLASLGTLPLRGRDFEFAGRMSKFPDVTRWD